MVSKDQAIGGVIFLVCVIVAIFYVVTLFYPDWLINLGWTTAEKSTIQFWLIAIPMFIAFVAIMGIGAWIGWTMATTPPPKPIEEITSEIEEKKEEEKAEEKPAETAPEETEEEKKPERKRKS
jgi:formate hydrogenlyase subunit 3/multisubunit Na+/H+ antiporter MnhD subunit